MAVVASTILGVSQRGTQWLLSCAKALVTTTLDSFRSKVGPADFVEEKTLEQMPETVTAALNHMASLKHKTTTYAVCTRCRDITPPSFARGSTEPYYPPKCRSRLVSDIDSVVCNAPLLEERQGKLRPISIFTHASLPDYLARELADPVVEQHCDDCCDEAYRCAQGPPPKHVHSPFEAEFLRNFKGPDGDTLYVQRPGSTARLVLAVHTDYFNPNGLTKRGATESVGVISLVNLALPVEKRYLPEHMFISGIIPGRREPSLSENAYYMRPIMNEGVQGWKGYHFERTALHPEGRNVQLAFIMSINDLPQARKLSGFAGHSSKFLCTVCRLWGRDKLYNTDWASWDPHDVALKRLQAFEWLNASSLHERKKLFEKNGVRWSEWWRLPYWNPCQMLVVDGMHCILEGLVHYHCRYVLQHQ